MLTKQFQDISLAATIRSVFFIALSIALCLLSLQSGQLQLLHWEWNIGLYTRLLLLAPSVLFAAFYLHISLRQNASFGPSSLPLVLFASFSCLILAYVGSLKLVIAWPLIAFIFGKILRLPHDQRPLWLLTDIGLALAPLLYLLPFSIFFLLLIWGAFLFFGENQWRGFVSPVLGVGMGVFTLAGIQQLLFGSFALPFENWQHEFSFGFSADGWKFWVPILVGLLLQLTDIFAALSKGRVVKRQSSSFLLFSGLLAVALIFCFDPDLFGHALLLLPMSFFAHNFLMFQRRWWLRDLVLLAPIITLLLLMWLR